MTELSVTASFSLLFHLGGRVWGIPGAQSWVHSEGPWGSEGSRLHVVVLSTQGAEGFQEEFSEGGGHDVVQDRGHR